jgi:alkylation response protein AidB-like acyl-CoA dehydrogenase
MDLSYTPEQLEFRQEVRAWIADAMPAEMRKHAEDGANFPQEETVEWHKILHAKGWVAPTWPEEVGGTGWDIGQRSIFQEECVRAGTPQLSPFGLSMVGPLIIQYGSDDQKKRFLPKILSGDEIWCQGYSEPNAGSDLANLQLRADKDGDDYILNGQKTWTTYAQ